MFKRWIVLFGFASALGTLCLSAQAQVGPNCKGQYGNISMIVSTAVQHFLLGPLVE